MGYWSLDRDFKDMSDVEIVSRLSDQNTERLFVVAEASRRGMPVEEIHRITGIDPWFLSKIRNLVALEETIKGKSFKEWTRELMMEAKRNGISDKAISQWQGVPEMEVRKLRKSLNVIPSYRMVDTCAARV